MRLKQTGIFEGRVQVRYSYGRFGWTRNGGKTWHGGIDLVALDDKTIRMPYYKGKKITGKVTRARIVYNHNDKTWEWGWYVCVQLDANQTPDTVNFLYFCHCSCLLVSVGQKVSSGDALAIMGQTGNAANGYDHTHLEARATARAEKNWAVADGVRDGLAVPTPWAFMAPRKWTGPPVMPQPARASCRLSR